MSDDIKVKPNPIQRNKLDVAIELTNLYFRVNPIENIEDVFSRFYALVSYLEYKSTKDLQNIVPTEIINAIGEIEKNY